MPNRERLPNILLFENLSNQALALALTASSPNPCLSSLHAKEGYVLTFQADAISM